MGCRPEAGTGSSLAANLRECVSVCEHTLALYRESEETTGKSFFSAVMLAMAGIERVIDAEDAGQEREVSLMIAASLAREAAQTVRRHGLDEQLLRCADACVRAALLCEKAPGAPPRL